MKLIANLLDNIQADTPGVVLSFDDSSRVDSWMNYHNDFGQFNGWKATFYCYIHSGYADEMKFLNDYGHEIGNHTKNHYNGVNEYIAAGNTPEDYYLEYLKPFDDWALSVGLRKVESFRFPYNFLNAEVKDWLLANDKYKIVTPGDNENNVYPIPSATTCIYDYNRLNYQFGLSMGRHRDWHNEQAFMDLLQYALDYNKVVQFYGHSIGESTWSIAITNWTLMEKITNFINDNNMKFYLVRELVDLTEQ